MGVDLLMDLTDGGVDRIDMLEERGPACVPETTKSPASVTRIGGGVTVIVSHRNCNSALRKEISRDTGAIRSTEITSISAPHAV